MGIKNEIESSFELRRKREEFKKKEIQRVFDLRTSILEELKARFKDLGDYGLKVSLENRQRGDGSHYPFLLILNPEDTRKRIEVTVIHNEVGRPVYHYGKETMYLERETRAIHSVEHLEQCLGEYLVENYIITPKS